MIAKIVFLSVSEMRAIKPRLDTLVVSILDCSESHQRPILGGFRSVLCLTFEDTYEEAKLAAAGDWPDEPSSLGHKKYAQRAGERIPALSDATQIVSFLKKHHQSTEALNLVVHCFGGISRSAAVAIWASKTFDIGISNTVSKSTERANKRLLRLMDIAGTQLQD